MIKIPVGQTIRFAYDFTFGQIGTIIGLIWIPTLINAVASFFVLGSYYMALADSFDSGLPPMGAQVALPFALAILTMILFAMIGVAITRQASGLRQGPAFAHFSLGSAELRAFGGFAGLYMLLVLFLLVFLAVVAGIALGGAQLAKPDTTALFGLGVGLLGLVGIGVMIYLVVRLSFLLVPAVVDGGEFGLTRSWQLTKGNFWRIVAVGCATMLPMLLVFGVAEFFILGPEFYVPDAAATNDAAIMHHFAQQMRAMQAQLPKLMGLSFVVSPVMYGLMFAPASFAYRVLNSKV